MSKPTPSLECPHPLEHLELTAWKEVNSKDNRTGLQAVIFCWACEHTLDFYFERPSKDLEILK